MRNRALLSACLIISPLVLQAQDTAPLSAIDWLSQSVEASVTPPSQDPILPRETPVANTASTPEITVTSLDRPSRDGIGLLTADTTGLPTNLWAASSAEELVSLISAQRTDSLPAVQELLVTLMLAEATPPTAISADGRFLLARADKLLDLAALHPARALLAKAGVDDPEIYRRWFDASLLTATEDVACEELRSRPALAPTYSARVFCTARNGNWTGAALTLNTARALGDVTDEDDALLSRFLDPAIAEEADPLPPPSRPSPLVFLMRDAIGEGLPTANLPLAFAHADLRRTVAWRNQLEAAERLARYGAISERDLLSFYTLRTPAASGGIWDRAEAIQRFDVAISSRDPGAVSATLPDAWQAMVSVKTEIPFARLYAETLSELPLTTGAAELADTIGLLGLDYETVALALEPQTEQDRLLQGIARGSLEGLTMPSSQKEAAVFRAFEDGAVSEPLSTTIAEGKLGEALLVAIAGFEQGTSGDPNAITDSLAALRAVGLEDSARRIALQFLILQRSS